MATGGAARIRQVLFQVHLWLALILFAPLVLLGLTGSVLVWPDVVEKLTNPVPAVAAGTEASRPPAAYLDAARAALPPEIRITGLKLPARSGVPVEVTATTGGSGPGAGRSVWLDPATGSVLKAGPTRSPLFAFSHDFHGEFLLHGGRTLVGWAGVVMLILALSGIWLWWPRGAFLKGFRWRRTPDTLNNLHHLTGFWISLPLALISLTGVFISFPSLTNAVFGPAPQAGGPPPAAAPASAAPPSAPRRTADQILALAQVSHPGAKLVSLALPGARGGRGQAPTPRTAWRVEFETGAVLVDDVSEAVSPAPKARPRTPPSGARALIRPLHDGGVGGPVWQWLVFIAGIVPAVLAFSGVFLWVRNERRKVLARSSGT